MPKEVVAREKVLSRETDGVEVLAELDISWHRDYETIQVSVTTYREKPKGEREERSLGGPMLTRDQVNHLIRTLRKARDQVYGRDE